MTMNTVVKKEVLSELLRELERRVNSEITDLKRVEADLEKTSIRMRLISIESNKKDDSVRYRKLFDYQELTSRKSMLENEVIRLEYSIEHLSESIDSFREELDLLTLTE